jgi:5'-methylthioadenosine phosphorylase
VESVIKVFNENNQRVKDVILDLIPRIPLDRTCPCATSLKGAVVS